MAGGRYRTASHRQPAALAYVPASALALSFSCRSRHPSCAVRANRHAMPPWQVTRVNAAAVTGSLPPRVRHVLNAGLFTPRVGRLGSIPRNVNSPGGQGGWHAPRGSTAPDELSSPMSGSSPNPSRHVPQVRGRREGL